MQPPLKKKRKKIDYVTKGNDKQWHSSMASIWLCSHPNPNLSFRYCYCRCRRHFPATKSWSKMLSIKKSLFVIVVRNRYRTLCVSVCADCTNSNTHTHTLWIFLFLSFISVALRLFSLLTNVTSIFLKIQCHIICRYIFFSSYFCPFKIETYSF